MTAVPPAYNADPDPEGSPCTKRLRPPPNMRTGSGNGSRAHNGHQKPRWQMLDLLASGQAQTRQKVARDWVFVGTPWDAGLPLVSGYSHVLWRRA